MVRKGKIINPFDSPGFAVLIREANEGGLKPGVCSGLILSGAFYPDLKIGVWRRERINMEVKMSADDAQDASVYKVVVNHEEQYSIWPANRENPLGWRDAGKDGTKEECLAYVKAVWIDMRPLSLRKKMQL